MIEPELRAMMVDSIHWEPVTGVDQYNKFTYGPKQLIEFCRVQEWTERITARGEKNAEEENLVPASIIFIADTYPIKMNDRITLDDGSVLRVYSVGFVKNQNGFHHMRLTSGLLSGQLRGAR